MNSKYSKVLKSVAEALERGKYMTSVQNPDRGILRICTCEIHFSHVHVYERNDT